ncbi:hypothetical protein JZX86_27640 [Agrobacterium rosae]|uniref:hypothetical protein n=1 Tax=Agrobacterium rosae TaxID=1972867 RepID=UPI0019D3835E|nr:hypothetical protein [Agrobacterium rosae]MBN7809096.1 hypothetical protein [Agrobacterium rosae]
MTKANKKITPPKLLAKLAVNLDILTESKFTIWHDDHIYSHSIYNGPQVFLTTILKRHEDHKSVTAIEPAEFSGVLLALSQMAYIEDKTASDFSLSGHVRPDLSWPTPEQIAFDKFYDDLTELGSAITFAVTHPKGTLTRRFVCFTSKANAMLWKLNQA